MSFRRQTIMFEMLMDVAKPREMKQFHTLMETSKGAATVYAMRIIKKHWDRLFKGKELPSELPQEGESDSYKDVKINYWKGKN